MPKEQIRKRGKRKPKTEEDAVADAVVVGHAAPASAAAAATPAELNPVEQAEADAAAGGIHPSRLAFLKTGVRPAPAPRAAPVDGAAAEGAPAQNEENGVADWTRGPRYESEFPFGVLDPDVKAYFRNVEEQVKDWEGVGSVGEEREDRQMFLSSVLTELRGHELQVATDPDTAVVLERLLPSLNDWGRRVVGDAVGTEWELLLRHRFGSHVGQTWLTLAAGTLDREARGTFPPQHHEQAKAAEKDTEAGVLPTMGELLTTVVNCLLPTLPNLLVLSHASPVLRLLLLVLTPNRVLPSLDSAEGAGGDLVRSKRSGKFRKGQGVQGKSILGDDEEGKKGKQSTNRKVPADVAALRTKLRDELMSRVSTVEWQSMGVDKVGSAAVQLLLEVEVEDGVAEKAGSLLDILTEGLVAHLEAGNTEAPVAQPFLTSLLVSPTGTRLYEAILRVSPTPVFDAVWNTYLVGKMGKFAGHPYANFVVAKGIARLNAEQLSAAIAEVQGVSGGRPLIKTARTAALVAFTERATALNSGTEDVIALIKSALDMPADSTALVPALMALKTVPLYEAILTGADAPDDADDALPTDARDDSAEATASAAAGRRAWENRRTMRPKGALEPNIQGCLLLQALVAMPTSNEAVLESLFAQPTETLLSYASSPIASRLLDAVLTTAAVPIKYRRKLYMAFMGQYHVLAQDRLGSRVADTVWDTADGYMREKIARSLIPHAATLGASQFGRFLSRRIELHLLERRPDEWREKQIGVKHHFAHQKEQAAPVARAAVVAAPEPVTPAQDMTEEEAAAAAKAARKAEKRKRKAEAEKDEIDVMFEGAEKKKKKKKRSKE